MRRRKKTSGDKPRLEKFPLTGTFCGGDGSIPCGEPQYKSPSGPVCKFGHGGAEMLDKRPPGDWVSGGEELDVPPGQEAGDDPDPEASKVYESARGGTEVKVPLSEEEQRIIDRPSVHGRAHVHGASDWERGEGQAATDASKFEEEAREFDKRPDAPFEVREGDRLSVTYAGAKLQIVQFNTVELDGAFYTRTLVPGDDPSAEWDRIYAFLRDKALAGAREKLATFADELRRSRERAKPGHPDGK